jgi:hypothetical protein
VLDGCDERRIAARQCGQGGEFVGGGVSAVRCRLPDHASIVELAPAIGRDALTVLGGLAAGPQGALVRDAVPQPVPGRVDVVDRHVQDRPRHPLTAALVQPPIARRQQRHPAGVASEVHPVLGEDHPLITGVAS